MKPDVVTSDLLQNLPPHKQLWLALSGGLDSVVLLDLAVEFCVLHQSKLNVVHVHHGLSLNADVWASHCLELCDQYRQATSIQLSSVVEKVKLSSGASIEEQARLARYQVFERCLAEGDLMLMAHHGDDQLETVLLRLMRGSGSTGLSGMPICRPLGLGYLYRPLLSVERSDLELYANKKGLSWVEDESNLSRDFDRNFLRHEIVPLLKQRWPQASSVIGRSTQVLAENAQLNDELAALDLSYIMVSDYQLSCCALLQLSPARQRNVLRFWLVKSGIRAPDYRHINTIIDELVLAEADAQPLFARSEYEVRRYQGRLFLILHASATTEGHKALLNQKEGEESENPASKLLLPIRSRQLLSLDGAAFQLLPYQDVEYRYPEDSQSLQLPAGSTLSLSYREGGESIYLFRRGRKTVKKLLQESGVPAWLRDKVRFFWLANESGEPQLIGFWSPLLIDTAQDAENPVSRGKFWWDVSVSEKKSDKVGQPLHQKIVVRAC
ncbi:tRNA lysidine(34) synthetase TilS [Oceanospirillum sp.]|uniref:tRNA lysidine(34) synthetase TilS n=1 Tax=Oceanospirillum sp. TaxID=2021254 RepID=UPI003A93D956